MQRLYAMFPDRGPGVGLLILRIAVGLMLLLGPQGQLLTLQGPWAMVGAWLAAVLVALGLLMPPALLMAMLLTLLRLPEPLAFCVLMHCAALALLGPGAYSLDAQLFGRRVVTPSKE